MKKICTLLTALTIGLLTEAQEEVRTASASKQTLERGENWRVINRSSGPTTIDTFHTALQFADSVYAYAGLDFTRVTGQGQDKADTASEYMILTDFGFNLPNNAIIGRIEVTFYGRSDRDTPVVFVRDVKLVRELVEEDESLSDPEPGFVSFNPTGEGKRSGAAFPPGEGNDSALIIGGAPAFWGGTITPAEVNTQDFGLAFRIVNTNPLRRATGYIDSVSVTIIYQAGVITPVTFINVSAKPVAGGTLITWEVADEIDVKEYEVERSDDGARFSKIGSVGANGNDTYTFTDVQPIKGAAFYRIKNVDLNGDYKYSTIITLRNGGSLVITRAYPLPARGNLTLQHNEAFRQSLITISSLDGKMVKTQRPSTGSIQTDIDLSGMQSGVYLLRYDDGRGQVETLKIVKQ